METLSFQLIGMEKCLAVYDTLRSIFIQQLSEILNLNKDCFRNPVLESGDYLIFHCNISSVCETDVVDIGAANVTFWRLLKENNLIFEIRQGEKHLAQSLTDNVVAVHLFIFIEKKPTMEYIQQLLKSRFPDLSIRDIAQPSWATALNNDAFVGKGLWNILLTGIFSCAQLKKMRQVPKTQPDSVYWMTTLLTGQNIPCSLDPEYSADDHIVYPPIPPSVNKPKERVVFNLTGQFNDDETIDNEDKLLAFLQKSSNIDSDFGNLILTQEVTICAKISSKNSLQIDWYNLKMLTDRGGVLKRFSGSQDRIDFVSALVGQYLEYYNISQKALLPGTNVTGVSYAGIYNGEWTEAMLTDVIQLSFAVATITGLEEVNRVTHGGIPFDYKYETLFAPLQFTNGSVINSTKIRTIEILIACPLTNLPKNNVTLFVDEFKKQLTKWTNIPPDFFMDHEIGPWTINTRSTQFRLNATNQFRNQTIDLDSLYGNFTVQLNTNKMAVMDEYNYPIHILPLKDNTFIIIGRYDETLLKAVPGIAATVILVLTVCYMDIKFRIKAWIKKRAAKNNAVSPQSQAE